MINDLVPDGKCTRRGDKRRRISTNTYDGLWIKRRLFWQIHVQLEWLISYFPNFCDCVLRTTRRGNEMKNYLCNLFDLLVCWQNPFLFQINFGICKRIWRMRQTHETGGMMAKPQIGNMHHRLRAPSEATECHTIENVKWIWTDLWTVRERANR